MSDPLAEEAKKHQWAEPERVSQYLKTEEGRAKIQRAIERTQAQQALQRAQRQAKASRFEAMAKSERAGQREANLIGLLSSARITREKIARAEALGIPYGGVKKEVKKLESGKDK